MLCCQLILVPAAASLAEGICLPQIPSVVCQIPIKIQYFWKKFQYFFRRKPVQTSCGHCPNFSTGISGCPWPFWPDTRRRSKEDTGGGGNKKQEHPTEGAPAPCFGAQSPLIRGCSTVLPPTQRLAGSHRGWHMRDAALGECPSLHVVLGTWRAWGGGCTGLSEVAQRLSLAVQRPVHTGAPRCPGRGEAARPLCRDVRGSRGRPLLTSPAGNLLRARPLHGGVGEAGAATGRVLPTAASCSSRSRGTVAESAAPPFSAGGLGVRAAVLGEFVCTLYLPLKCGW